MSEIEPYPFTAPLTVCVDFKNPHAYLAKDLVYELEDDLGLHADWLPFLVPGLRPPPAESDDRGVRHRRRRALYVELDIQRYAKVRGLVIRDIYRQVDSTMAALALLWVRGTDKLVRRTTIDALFSGHWNGHLNIEDVAAVTAVLEGARADLGGWPEFQEDAGRAELQRLHARLATAGIFNAPAIVVGTADSAEIFYGRAHLPMVRWLLQGRTGPPPI